MDLSPFRAAFPRQLRYWTLHCLLNALPSFIIAAVWLELWQHATAMWAMLAAIGCFILLYAGLTSSWQALSEKEGLLARSLRLGAKIRAWISLGSLPLLTAEPVIMWTPDLWCGWLAVWLQDGFSKFFLGRPTQGDGPDGPPFMTVFVTTMLEGFILSFLLLMISFFAVIFLQARDRRKAFANAA